MIRIEGTSGTAHLTIVEVSGPHIIDWVSVPLRSASGDVEISVVVDASHTAVVTIADRATGAADHFQLTNPAQRPAGSFNGTVRYVGGVAPGTAAHQG